MFSTIALVKNARTSGRIVGTHQILDLVARRVLAKELPRGKFFPSGKEIIHFEGMRGPDGLKRKSPGEDDPSHLLTLGEADALETPDGDHGHESLDDRSVMTMIQDHQWNLAQALKRGDKVRSAFEAAWLAHMITDGLTPAHHFPLSEVQDELMTDEDFVRVFGAPIKGLMHGRNMLETLRNNWLYWGAKGHMSQHIAYELGVAMLVMASPRRALTPEMSHEDFLKLDWEKEFEKTLAKVRKYDMYERFRAGGWTTELALETKKVLVPEIIRSIALGWYAAVAEAYKLGRGEKYAPKGSRK